MRILLAATLLTLSACQSPPAADNAPQANEAAVEAQLANEQDAIAQGIDNDAANQIEATGDMVYACDDGTNVSAVYADDGNSVRITIAGQSLTLNSVPAASGSKYRSETGLTPVTRLTWWSKGDAAMLIQGPRGAKPGEGETTVNCLAAN